MEFMECMGINRDRRFRINSPLHTLQTRVAVIIVFTLNFNALMSYTLENFVKLFLLNRTCIQQIRLQDNRNI